jgi:hypothetical protein
MSPANTSLPGARGLATDVLSVPSQPFDLVRRNLSGVASGLLGADGAPGLRLPQSVPVDGGVGSLLVQPPSVMGSAAAMTHPRNDNSMLPILPEQRWLLTHVLLIHCPLVASISRDKSSG